MRFIVRWVLNALVLWGIAYYGQPLGILPNLRVDGFEAAVVAVAILAFLNLTVRPILKLLTLPITCLTFGLFSAVINALMMLLTARLVRGFEVGSFWDALIASVIYAVLSAAVNALLAPAKE